ncbi:hypothetical protein L596_013782 [Steinernema carpocapsae]|uniref:Uncharacterized protein n=1 Tax=Steinernema carpocapsae TaxID=34508 RepID=A0A4U5P2C2_STECR|nr:hypothetical protein L596_013782 [Steinernema carpocapsae]
MFLRIQKRGNVSFGHGDSRDEISTSPILKNPRVDDKLPMSTKGRRKSETSLREAARGQGPFREGAEGRRSIKETENESSGPARTHYCAHNCIIRCR